MSGTRIILGSLIGASVRHGIFTVVLPWLILYRTAGMEEMGFQTGYSAAGWVLVLLGAVLYIRAFAERLRMTAVVIASTATSGSGEDSQNVADAQGAADGSIATDAQGTADGSTATDAQGAADGSTATDASDFQSLSGDDPAGDSRPIWSEGVHGWSRNPLLLGVVLILIGECLAFESLALLVYAGLYWTWLTLYLVFAEEPALRRTLGDEYLQYCRHVPRWFLRMRFRKPA